MTIPTLPIAHVAPAPPVSTDAPTAVPTNANKSDIGPTTTPASSSANSDTDFKRAFDQATEKSRVNTKSEPENSRGDSEANANDSEPQYQTQDSQHVAVNEKTTSDELQHPNQTSLQLSIQPLPQVQVTVVQAPILPVETVASGLVVENTDGNIIPLDTESESTDAVEPAAIPWLQWRARQVQSSVSLESEEPNITAPIAPTAPTVPTVVSAVSATADEPIETMVDSPVKEILPVDMKQEPSAEKVIPSVPTVTITNTSVVTHAGPSVGKHVDGTSMETNTVKLTEPTRNQLQNLLLNSNKMTISSEIADNKTDKVITDIISGQNNRSIENYSSSKSSTIDTAEVRSVANSAKVESNMFDFRSVNMNNQATVTPQVANEQSRVAPSTVDVTNGELQRMFGSLKLQTGSNEWNNQLVQQVRWLSANQSNTAEIRLDPPELGTINVKIKVSADQQVNVSFTPQHSAVKETLEQTLPRLKEMLEAGGMSLGDVDVSDQSLSQGTDEEVDSDDEQLKALGGAGSDDDANVEEILIDLPRRSEGIVDSFV